MSANVTSRRKDGKRNSIDTIGRTYCRPDMTMAERVAFVGTTQTPSGCQEWNGSRSDVRYPLITIKRKTRAVHRWVLEQKLGRPLAPGEVCRHRCDNPPCINPEHLEPGSYSDNANDALMRGRQRHFDGGPGVPRLHRRKWDDATLQQIRDLRAAGAAVPEIVRETGASTTFVYGVISGYSNRLPIAQEPS